MLEGSTVLMGFAVVAYLAIVALIVFASSKAPEVTFEKCIREMAKLEDITVSAAVYGCDVHGGMEKK